MMSKKNTAKLPKPKKKLIATITILLTLLALASIAWFFPAFGAPKNYAKQTAEPIEAALMKAGAVKKCEDGDAGRGSDNRAPNYGAVFETNLNRDEAINLISRMATNYKLQATDSSYENIVSYYGNKLPSTHEELREGVVIVGVSLYDGGQQLSCINTQVKYDKSHVAIKLDVSLPEYK